MHLKQDHDSLSIFPVITRIVKCAKIFAYRYQFLILYNINSIEAYWHNTVQAPEAFS